MLAPARSHSRIVRSNLLSASTRHDQGRRFYPLHDRGAAGYIAAPPVTFPIYHPYQNAVAAAILSAYRP